MEPKQNYLLVGLFVLAAVAGLFTFIAWMTGSGDKRNFTTYETYFTDSVTGLNEGAAVRYRGVEVGKVTNIAIDKMDAARIRITMRIAEGTPITENTVAVLKLQGITGLAYVELSGNGGSPLQAKEGEIPVIASRPSEFSQIVSSVPEILDRFSRVAEQLQRLMSDENVNHISATLANIEQFSGAFNERNSDIRAVLKDMRRAMDELAATAHTVNGIASNSQEDVQKTIQDTGKAMEQLSTLLERTNQFSDNGYRELGALLVELKQTAREIRALTHELRENPSKIVVPEKPRGVKVP